MKQLLFIICVVLTLALTSATVFESVALNQDTRDASGTFIGPRSSLSGTAVEGYLCGDAPCTFSAGTFFTSTSITGTSTSITYPTTLITPFGYALFYTKTGFIPYEVKSTYAGTGSVAGEAVLTQKQTCTIPLTITSVQNTTSLSIAGTVTAPISHAGPLPFVPPSLLTHYQTPLLLTLSLTNSSFSSSTTNYLTLNFSETRPFTLTHTAPNGTYTYALTATSTDAKCLTTPATSTTGSITLGTLPTTNTTTVTLPLITIISPTARTYNVSSILINLSTVNATSATVALPGTFATTPYTTPFTIALPNGTYTLIATAYNGAGSATTAVTFAVNTTSSGNTTTTPNLPPATVTNLRATNQTTTSITWNWTNPSDTDFSHVQLFLNNLFVGNSTATSYHAPSLLPNTTYTLTLFTVDNASIINTTGMSNTSRTLPLPLINNVTNITTTNASATIPGPVTNLQALTNTNTSIVWNWTNPTTNFSYVTLYLNGIFQTNTSSTNYTALNLVPNTQYTLTVFTFNASGAGSGIPTTNTTSTLPNPTVITNQTNPTSGTGKNKRYVQTTNYTGSTHANTAYFLNASNEPLVIAPQKQYTFTFSLLSILFALLILLLLALIALLTATTSIQKKPYVLPNKA